MSLQYRTQLTVNRHGIIGRRDFLKLVGAAGSVSGLSLTDQVSLHAAELRKQGMACILLWMGGGPSQFDTLDPKPGHANGGDVKAIATRTTGVQWSANLPKLAQQSDKLAVFRSLTTKEGNHQRASYLLHTSYVPSSSVNYPTLGSAVANAIRNESSELPAFVRIGRTQNSGNGGFLGTEFDAFQMNSATRMPDNVRPATDAGRYQRRLGLLGKLEDSSGPEIAAEQIGDHRKLYEQASKMILSPSMQAFDVNREPDKVRDAYGRGEFGTGCLVARRLIETGVTFVEVSLGNWDTHDNNGQKCADLCGQLDQPFAYLLEDLSQRGMLDRTLVVWMGEFGRTPRLNPRGGRDHYPRAFSAALAGGGVRGGQVIGATSASGEDVDDAPVTEKDFLQTIYKSLKIDARKENMSPIGRPIKLVDGGEPVAAAFA
jgi:hypothetical protein